MNKILYLIIFLFTCGFSNAQNLVPNGDFEQYSGCPVGYSQFDSCLFWINPAGGGGIGGSPDYFNQCATNNFVGVPVNIVGTGYQFAHSGGAYCGGYIWSAITPNLREYIEVPLTSTLIANQTYHLEMYVNLTNSCKFSTHDIGVYFSDTMVTGINNYYPLPLVPQINNVATNSFDTLNWTLVSGNYLAHGGEGYLIIGNFKVDSATSSFVINPLGTANYIYILIDDVSLTLHTGIEEQNENTEVRVYPNPSKDIINITSKRNEQLEVCFYDITSRKLLSKLFVNSTSINAEHLAKGIYIYEVRNKNGVIKKGKVVKE